jgi:hypothetical protein
VNLGRLWRSGRGPETTRVEGDDLPPALRNAIVDLDRLIEARPELAEPGEMVARIVRAAFSIAGSPEPSLRPGEEGTDFLIERIREGWDEGVTAVRVVRPALDPSRLTRRADAIARCSDPGFVPAGRFRELTAKEPGKVAELAMTLLMDGDQGLEASLGTLVIEPGYGTSVLRLVLLGELGDWSARICSHLGDTSWPRGDCPVCGAWPALGESRGLEQRRFLRCDHCGAGWPGNRLQCPFCGQSAHHALHYLYSEGEQDRYRLALCDGCEGRIKLIATLAPLSPPALVVAQLAMVHLDLIGPQDTTATLS